MCVCVHSHSCTSFSTMDTHSYIHRGENRWMCLGRRMKLTLTKLTNGWPEHPGAVSNTTCYTTMSVYKVHWRINVVAQWLKSRKYNCKCKIPGCKSHCWAFCKKQKKVNPQLHTSMNGSASELYGCYEAKLQLVRFRNPNITCVPAIMLTFSGDVALYSRPRFTVQIIY